MSTKNILFVNDTSSYHCGCKLTCEILKDLIWRHNTITRSIEYSQLIQWENINLKNIDIVIINGEGTFHHNNKGAQNIIDLAKKAKEKGKIVCLINTVIDSIDYDMSIFDYISCRESLSAQGKYNITHDACFFKQVDSSTGKDILFSDGISNDITKQLINIRIKYSDGKYFPFNSKYSYNEMINHFKNSRLIVTGRYHGVVFAIMTGKPFLVVRSNSHKIDGLCKDYNLEKNIVNINELENKINNNDYLIPDVDTIQIRNNIIKMIDCCFKI